jgi:outer membrane protein assembly factor BamB
MLNGLKGGRSVGPMAHRRSLLPATALLAVFVVIAGCAKKAPARPEKPTGRTHVPASSSATYSSVTTDPNQDSVLYVFDWGDGLSDTTGLVQSGDTAAARHAWAGIGVYAVRARAQDSKGYWSGWSAALTVTAAINQPPDAPLRPSHAGIDSVGKPIAFTTSATDPDGDSVRTRYFFAEGQVSGYGPEKASGAAYTDTVIYSQNGWKVVFAAATDGTDTSAWSTPDSIYIKSPNVAPYAPEIRTQYTPSRGIPNGPAYRFYAAARDQYGDSLYYRWYFDGTDSVTSGLFPSGVEGYAEWTPTGDTHSYAVTVRVFDESGKTNPTTPTMVFKTVAEGEIVWDIPGEFVASPAIGPSLWRGDTRTAIICGSTDGYLYVADAYQSFLINQMSVIDPDAYNSSATIGADGTRYVGNENGWFYAFNSDDSRDTFKWRFGNGVDGMTATAALAGDGTIYCGGEDLLIHKLIDNGTSATEAWSYRLSKEMLSSPAIGPDGSIYCCDYDGYAYALNGDSTLRWSVRIGDTAGIYSSPAVASDGTVYVGTETGRLMALRDGNVVWSYEVDPPLAVSSSPIVGPDGNIYFGCGNGKLYRIDQNSHQPVTNWPIVVTTTDFVSSTPLLCADDVIYVADDSSLYAFDVNNPSGGPRWKSTLVPPGKGRRGRLSLDNQPSPAVDQYGIVYISTGNGIFAVAGRPGGTLAATDWPMFHHDAKHSGRFGAR